MSVDPADLEAMSSRIWDQPLDWPTFDGPGTPVSGAEVTAVIVAHNTGRDTGEPG